MIFILNKLIIDLSSVLFYHSYYFFTNTQNASYLFRKQLTASQLG